MPEPTDTDVSSRSISVQDLEGLRALVGVPSDWEREVLLDHATEVMSNPTSSYDTSCVLCQRAGAAGLFDAIS